MKENYENLKEEFWNGINELKKAQNRLTESQEETDRKIQETAEQMKETDKLIGKLTKNIDRSNGNFDNKWGLFLENLVKGDLVKLLKKRGVEVERIWPRMILKGETKGKTEGEIDLIAVNGNELVAVEVKNDLRKEYVDHFVGQLKRLKKYWPEFSAKKVYGGMVYLDCQDKRALVALKENGPFIIKAVGGETDVTVIDNPKDFRPKEY